MFPASLGKLRPQIEYKFWASAGHGQTLDELITKMEEVGNTVLERDEENQRLLVAKAEERGQDIWGCILCLAVGQLVILDTHRELEAHCDIEHEGWREQAGS